MEIVDKKNVILDNIGLFYVFPMDNFQNMWNKLYSLCYMEYIGVTNRADFSVPTFSLQNYLA